MIAQKQQAKRMRCVLCTAWHAITLYLLKVSVTMSRMYSPMSTMMEMTEMIVMTIGMINSFIWFSNGELRLPTHSHFDCSIVAPDAYGWRVSVSRRPDLYIQAHVIVVQCLSRGSVCSSRPALTASLRLQNRLW